MIMRDEFKKGRVVTLPNLKVEWCYLVDPDLKFGKSQWCVDVRLPEDMAKSLKEVGFNVKYTGDKKKFKEGDELYYFLKCYRKTMTGKGPLDPPKVLDAMAQPMDGKLVGNGSTCNVKIWAKYITVNEEVHLPARLTKIQVVELVEYSGDGDDGFEPVEGVGTAPEMNDLFGAQSQGVAF